MRYFLLATLALLVPAAGFTAPLCTSGSLATYEAMPGGTCQIGNFIFGSFTYSYVLTDNLPSYYAGLGGEAGDGVALTDTDVTVNPSGGAGGAHFSIGNAPWTANGWQSAILNITFTIQMVSGDLKSATANFNGGTTSGAGSAVFFASVAPPDAATNFLTTPVGGTYTYPTAPPSYPVVVTLSAWIKGNSPADIPPGSCPYCDGSNDAAAIDYIFAQYSNEAHLSDINLDFTSPSGVPEPGTWLTAVAGLGLAGWMKRRRAA